MSQENVEIVRMAYAAMSEPDFDALTELTDSDWVFDFSRAIGPQKGVYRGHDEIAQFAAATAEAFEKFHLSPIEFSGRTCRPNRRAASLERKRTGQRRGVGPRTRRNAPVGTSRRQGDQDDALQQPSGSPRSRGLPQ